MSTLKIRAGLALALAAVGALAVAGCAQPSTSSDTGPATSASAGSPAPSGLPARLDAVPVRDVPVTAPPVPAPAVTPVRGLAESAAVSKPPLPGVFLTMTGMAATTLDCGAPQRFTVSRMTPAGVVTPMTRGWLTALFGSGGDARVLVLGVRDYGGPDSSVTDRTSGYLRIDLATGKVLGLTPTVTQIEGTYGRGGTTGGVWVGVDAGTIGLLDLATGRILRSVKAPAPITRVMASDSVLWVANDRMAPYRKLWRLDPDSGAVLDATEWREIASPAQDSGRLDRSRMVLVGDNVVLVDSQLVVTRVAPDGSAVAVRVTGLGTTDAGLPRGTAGDAWIGTATGALVRLDGNTLDLVGAATVPGLVDVADVAAVEDTVALMQQPEGKARLVTVPLSVFGG